MIKTFTKLTTKLNLHLNARWFVFLFMLIVSTNGALAAWSVANTDKLYFDNSKTAWSQCYIQIGHCNGDGYDKAFEMQRVANTKNLWVNKSGFGTWSDAESWYITSEKWNTSGEKQCSKLKACWHSANTFMHPYTTDFGNNKVYKASANNQTYTTTDCSKAAWSWSATVATYSSSLAVTLENYVGTTLTADAGTITVKKWNSTTSSAGSAYSTSFLSTSSTSTSGTTGYLTALEVTVTPQTGYKLKSLTVGGTSVSSGHQFELTAATTIKATWELDCPAPEMPTATVEKHTTKCDGTDRNQGVIKLTNYNSAYTYKLGNGTVTVSSDGKMSGLPTGKYYITAVSSCGAETKSSSTFDVNITDVTPVATVEVTGDNEICSGKTTTLTATVTATLGTVSSYSWSPNNGTKDGNKYTTPALTETKSYLAQAKLTNDNCEKTISATGYKVTVKTAPEKPSVTLLPADGNIISGNKATLSISSHVDGATYTLYEETKGEIETGTSFEITEAGTYYVKGANDCGDSPASDSKTITVCTIGSTLNSAEYDAATQKVSLEGTFELCGKESFHGFQWRKEGSDWCEENVPTDNSAYVMLGKTTEGGTKSGEYTIEDQNSAYVFRTYVVPVGGAWIYGNEITVTPCITVAAPNVTAEAICAGSEATLTLNNKQSSVTYKLGNEEIFKTGNTHTVKPEKTTTYTITATSTISCDANQSETTTVKVEVYELPDAPSIKEETTVCPNTAFELPSIGDGKWYAQAEGGSAYATTTISGITETTYYYAEAVKYGCASATRTKYTVNVHTAPVAPDISLNPATVGQDKNSVLSISDATYSPSNTKYVLYKGTSEVGEMTSQTTNVSSSDVGSVKYTVKATHKECAALTSTSNEVTLTVQEAGAQIAALGDLKVDPQDPIDFVAMHVKNDGLSDYTEQGATKVTGYTWQISTDGGNNWTDCGSTATLGVNNGSDKCNNFRPSAVGKYRCKITYDAGNPNYQYSNYLDVTGDATTARTFKDVTMNIPVISVNTGSGKFPTCDGLSGTASKNADVMKEKISVDVKIFNADGTVYYDRKARMNYRGSSSLNFVKKSYAFCTGKEKTKNDKGAVDTGKENLFGLSNGAKDKDWVLYAAAADPSIMRNRLMFDTFHDMTGGWSVNSMYVELVINGEYKGVYVLMDKITANEKRVNVSWKLDKQGNTTQEGFIVKFDKTDIVDRYENTSGDQKTFKSTYSGHDGFGTYDTNIDQRFEVEYPEKEDIEEEDLEKGQQAGDWSVVFNSIKDKFNKFEKELKDGNFSEVQKIIDYQSWADWFIITEFGKNIDGYRASNLFVYDGSKPNAKIEARPLWDQELSFNNTCPNYYESYGAGSETGFIVENSEGFNNDASTPFWFTGKYKGGRGTYNGSDQTFKGLLDDPCFVAMVKTRWETHKANALSKATLEAKLTAYTDEMGAAKDREATFWSTRSRETCQCSYGGTTGYNNIDFATSKGTISSWIKDRPAGLNTAINGLTGLDLTISFTMTPADGVTTPWEAVMVQVNNPSGYDYDLKYTNDLDKVEGVIIQESNDKYTYRIPRPWESGDGTREAIEYGIEATLNVAEEGNQCGSEIGEELTKATATITLKDEDNDGCE